MNGAHKSQQTWYIGKVVSVADKEHRQRIQVRRPTVSSEDIADDKLAWLHRFPSNQDSFDLPEVGTSVLVLMFEDLHFWLELPNKAAWQNFGDDYDNAWLRKHKDKLEAMFKEADGFSFTLNGNVAVKSNKTSVLATDSMLEVKYDGMTLKSDGTDFKLTVGNVEISTDGSKVSVKNGSQSLAKILDDMMQTLQQHVHPTPAGPSGPPAAHMSKLAKHQSDYKQLLK